MPASAVCLAHVDRNPDPGLHAELAAAGAYLGYDGWARTQRWPDSVLLACLLAAAARGAADRLLLGGDVARATRYRAYGGMPGLAYLGERVLPRLQAEAPPGLVDLVLRDNPARWLTGTSFASASERSSAGGVGGRPPTASFASASERRSAGGVGGRPPTQTQTGEGP